MLVLLAGSFTIECAVSDVNASGSNTLRIENYESDGQINASPYPFSGSQIFNDFNINANDRISAYERWNMQLFGVLNNSAYRSSQEGLIPERITAEYEKGDYKVPFRLHVGDYFGHFSRLTMQQSLKGAQLEIQPENFSAGISNSVLFLFGENDPFWKDSNLSDNRSMGASWVMAGDMLGSLSFNLVQNSRDKNTKIGLLNRAQTVTSVGYEKSFLGIYDFELEVARFSGDHDGLTTPATGQDVSGSGYAAGLSHQFTQFPFDVSFVTENYDEHYRPVNSEVTPDSNSIEFRGGWRTASHIQLNGHFQSFSENSSTSNELVTDTIKIGATGSFDKFITGVSGKVDFLKQDSENDKKTVSLGVNIFDANLSRVFDDRVGNFGLFVKSVSDDTAAKADSSTRQISVSVDQPFAVKGFNGMVTPGLVYRDISDTGESKDLNPTVAVTMRKGHHRLDLNYGYLTQDRPKGASDFTTQTAGLDYRYDRKRNSYGVEVTLFDLEQDPGKKTDVNVISVFWTHNFDYNQRLAVKKGIQRRPSSNRFDEITADPVDLGPGTWLTKAESTFEQEGYRNGLKQGNHVVYEFSLLKRIRQRQRIVLEHRSGRVTKSAWILDFDDLSNSKGIEKTFKDVRSQLIKRYGAPSFTFVTGSFSTASIVAAINTKRLIRIDEWQTPRGTLRFGIPQRLDGQVRMELQHRVRFGSPRETRWSLEGIR